MWEFALGTSGYVIIALVVVVLIIMIVNLSKKGKDKKPKQPKQAKVATATPLETVEVDKLNEHNSNIDIETKAFELPTHELNLSEFDQQKLSYDQRRVPVDRTQKKVKDPTAKFASILYNELGYRDVDNTKEQVAIFADFWPNHINEIGELDFWKTYDTYITRYPVSEYIDNDISKGKNIKDDVLLERSDEVAGTTTRIEDGGTVERAYDTKEMAKAQEIAKKIESTYGIASVKEMIADTFVKQKKLYADELNAYGDELIIKIEEFLKSIDYVASVEGFIVGPQIILFELKPGQKADIAQFANQRMALEKHLNVANVRINLSIPNSSMIGLEVPHGQKLDISFKEMILGAMNRYAENVIVIPIGLDELGKYRYVSLEEAINMLVIGQAVSGKTTFTQSALAAILTQYRVNKIDVNIFDFAGFDFSKFTANEKISSRIYTKKSIAADAIKRLSDDLIERQSLIQNANAGSFEAYNNIQKRNGGEELKRTFIFINEIADLKEHIKDLEGLVTNAKYVGMHFIISTAHSNELTERIKRVITARVVFETETAEESEMMIRTDGAKYLLGAGDAIFSINAGKTSIRVQTPYLDATNLSKLVKQIAHKKEGQDEN